MRSHLFCLQRELNENLLQLLVDKVDAELLEAVSLKEETEVTQQIVRFMEPINQSINQ